jgi:hypothetical protein
MLVTKKILPQITKNIGSIGLVTRKRHEKATHGISGNFSLEIQLLSPFASPTISSVR